MHFIRHQRVRFAKAWENIPTYLYDFLGSSGHIRATETRRDGTWHLVRFDDRDPVYGAIFLPASALLPVGAETHG